MTKGRIEIPAAAEEAAEKAIFRNVRAYGKAWTGEGEDTDFIIGDAPRLALEAAYPHLLAAFGERLETAIKARAEECRGQLHSSVCSCSTCLVHRAAANALEEAVGIARAALPDTSQGGSK